MEKARVREITYQDNWVEIIKNAQSKGEIKNDIDATVLAMNIVALAGSIFKSILKEQSIDKSFLLLNKQYDQLYSLIKL